MMSDDRLADVLREVDASIPPGTCSADLAGRVYAADRRRRLIRRMTGAVAAGFALTFVTYLVAHRSDEATLTTPLASVTQDAAAAKDARAELAELRSDIARLRNEINAAAETMQSLREWDDRHQLRHSGTEALPEPTPSERLKAELDKTALIMVHRGDLMHRTYGLVEPARESYRRVIELFPDSRWADVARERLTEIANPKGDQL